MNRRLVLAAACVFAINAQFAFAQEPVAQQQTPRPFAVQPVPADKPVPPPPPPRPAPAPQTQPKTQSVNVRVEVTITEQKGTAPALKKTVSLVTGDGLAGSIRSSAPPQPIAPGSNMNASPTPLNIDARPTLLADGKIRLIMSIVYEMPNSASDAQSVRNLSLSESLQLILESGKSVVAAESPDPVGDRQFTIEVKATILK